MRRAGVQRHSLIALCALGLIVGASGCDRVNELMQEMSGDQIDDPVIDLTSNAPAPPIVAGTNLPAPPANLPLVGERIPYLKTVEQELTQPTPNGSFTSRSRTDFMLSLTVEETTPDRVRWNVRYERVRHSLEMGETSFVFDSAAPQAQVPPEALQYQGLAGNGFSFWRGTDNRIMEFGGFEQFLARCFATLSPEQQNAIVAQYAQVPNEQRLGTFVDESLNYLAPSGTRTNATFQIGDRWVRTESISQPVSFEINQQLSVEGADQNTIQLQSISTFAPKADYGNPASEQREVQVALSGGRAFGEYRFDRRTNLPITAKSERNLEMTVTLADGSRFTQQTRVMTTLQVAGASAGISAPAVQSEIQQVSTSPAAPAPAAFTQSTIPPPQ